MEDEIVKMKFNKLISEFKYLEDELSFVNKVIEKTSPEFNLQFHTHMKEIGKEDLLIPKKSESQPNRAQRRAAKKASKATQDIFKKIAKQIHPDKNMSLGESEREKINNIFIKASEAKEQDSLLKLSCIAKDLGIDVGEITTDKLVAFEKEIFDIKQKINTNQKSWLYTWASSKGVMKEEIIKGYARYFIDREKENNSED